MSLRRDQRFRSIPGTWVGALDPAIHFRNSLFIRTIRGMTLIFLLLTVLLPERDWIAAIARVNDLNVSQQILSKGIKSVDMRLDGRVTVEVAEIAAGADGTDKKTLAKR